MELDGETLEYGKEEEEGTIPKEAETEDDTKLHYRHDEEQEEWYVFFVIVHI